MGIVERKEREKQEMRELILNAAKEMFIQEGFEKTSLRKVAEKIDYSPTTIYLYFKDKNEIFHALMEIGFSKLMDEFNKIIDIADPLERLLEIGRAYIKFAINNTEIYDLMFIMLPPMERVHDLKDWDCGYKTFMALHNTVEECINKGLFKIDNPYVGSLMLWSQVHGVVSLYIRQRLIMYPADKVMELLFASTNAMIDSIKK